MPTLDVHNAEIRTATVEVQTLTISGKQVTQAVFRQLPERTLVNEDGRLNGQAWGWVNHHPDKCSAGDDHLHIVWQSGKALFRSRVDMHVTYPRWITADAASAWLDAKVREDAVATLTGWTPMAEEFPKKFLGVAVHMVMTSEARSVTATRNALQQAWKVVTQHGPSHPVRVYGPARTRALRPASSGLAAARSAAMEAARSAARREIPASEALIHAEDEFEKALAALPTTPLVEAEARLLAEIRSEANRRRRHSDVRRALADLPQLFIAV